MQHADNQNAAAVFTERGKRIQESERRGSGPPGTDGRRLGLTESYSDLLQGPSRNQGSKRGFRNTSTHVDSWAQHRVRMSSAINVSEKHEVEKTQLGLSADRLLTLSQRALLGISEF